MKVFIVKNNNFGDNACKMCLVNRLTGPIVLSIGKSADTWLTPKRFHNGFKRVLVKTKSLNCSNYG